MSNAASELHTAGLDAAAWFFENALDAFIVADDQAVLRVNPAWTAFTGWSEAESVGKAWRDFVPAEELAQVEQFYTGLGEAGEAVNEHRIRTKDGRLVWARSRVKRTPDGRAMALVKNIDAERRHEEYVKQAGSAAELLSMTAGVFLWGYDVVAESYDLNPLGHGPHDAVPARVSRAEFSLAIHREDLGEVNDAWTRTRLTGQTATLEYRYRYKGAWRRLRTVWRGLRQRQTGEWDILGISQDITALTEARDAALAAAEAKSQFLANMSHEIRTPMNGVLGVLHILRSAGLSAENRRLVEEALACGTTLSQLLNDIVDFSKVDAGCLELSPEPVELGGVVDSVAAMLRAEAEGRGLYLVAETPAEPSWATIDPVRLRQILFNLVGNAVKFTTRGGVRVRLSTSSRDAGQRLRVEVHDTGVGIAEAAQASIFERFQQGDGSATRRFGGAGLGLAVTKALVDQMGGAVNFSSQAGVGSTFWVELPAPACAAPEPDAEAGERWLEGLRVLVVEDNPTNRLVATKMLSELGASVDTAEDGAEGVECATRVPYDLIFMDIQMPVMDGVEATRRIRALPPPIGQTPIVATTANVLAHQIETYRQSGMNGCVAKPISPAALLTEISRLAQGEEEAAA